MKESKEGLLFCEQKRSKKNFISFGPRAVSPPREAEQSFFGSFFSKKELLPCFFLGLAALSAAKPAQAITFCVDKSNPMFTIDQSVATAAAAAAGQTASFYVHDSATDDVDTDSGNKQEKYFAKLAKNCDLIMGFPVEAGFVSLPRGMTASQPYLRTGFVAATTTAPLQSFNGMVAREKIGVVMLTVPSTYFTDQTMHAENVYVTNDELLTALKDHEVDAALVWQPWLISQLTVHQQSVHIAALQMPHAAWNLVALVPQSAQSDVAVRAFNKGLQSLAANGKLGPAVRPFEVPQINE